MQATTALQAHIQHLEFLAKEATLAACREDPRVFCEYVLRNESDGKPITQAPVHDEWQVVLCREPRTVLWSHVEAGKTNQISIGRVLWELGRNPNLRIAILTKTHDLSKKIVKVLAQYIEKSEALHEVFPALRPARDRSLSWSAHSLTVERDIIAKEPSIQATHAMGSINGARIDLAVIDDLVDYKNTRSKSARDELWTWLQSTLQGRLTDDSRVWAITNAWHPDDAMHRMAKLTRYTSHRYPVVDEAGKLTWPEVWPKTRIENKKLDLGDPAEYARQLLCIARDDGESAFKQEWLDVGIFNGRGYGLVHSLYDEDGTSLLPPGFHVFHGVDLASRKSEAADSTSIFSIMLHPNGKRQVINIYTKKLNGPEIITAIDDINHRYGGIFIVENVAAQQYILDFAAKGMTRATLIPFTTGRNKMDPYFGVQSLGAELAAGKWIIPNRKGRMHPEVEAWFSEMLFFNPKDHTGDRLMASWFAREGARQLERLKRLTETSDGGGGVRILGEDVPEESRSCVA